jgi:hypothetical protein
MPVVEINQTPVFDEGSIVFPTFGCFHGLEGVSYETVSIVESVSYIDIHDESGVRIEVRL